MSVKELLDKTFQSAETLLKMAVADQVNIEQAAKMVNAETILGSTDDTELEELRWYVYPQECAMYLKRGITEAPTLLSGTVLGALDPLQTRKGKLGGNVEETLVLSARKRGAEIEHTEYDIALPMKKLKAGTAHERIEATLATFPILKVQVKKANRDSSTWGTGSALKQAAQSSETPGRPHTLDSHVSSELVYTKKKRFPHHQPPPKMMRFVNQAVIQWDMLQNGDKLLLGLSGGKDSLSLLHVLLELRRKLAISFEIEVCTIDPMTPSFDPSPLIPYVESLGLKYHYIRDDIVSRASSCGTDGKMVSSLCAYCARMKRGNLYACARKNSCNKLVLAQHLDDCAESFMMSVMHNGFLRTMKANYKINAGDISVIRPFVYCRESLMTDFAKRTNLPVVNENCPACFEEPKERARVKKLLSREETLYPNFYDSIKRSLMPLMHEDATAILRCYTEEAITKSRKKNRQKKIKGHEENKEPDKAVGGSKEGVEDLDLSGFSDDALLKELARRRAAQYRLAGAMKRTNEDDDAAMPVDETGQFCSLNGGEGSIPCNELME
jgi:tRNA(Ile)-lysidine synthase TilS/MesJ